MKKLKTTSPLNLLILTVFIISILFTIFKINISPKSIYNLNTTKIEGTITKCQKTDNSYKITLKAQEKILINYYNDFNCQLGSKIIASGEPKKPASNTVFNLFNYQKYLLSEKINYIMTAKAIRIIEKPSNLYQLKNNLISHINNYKSKEYLNTFILGNNKDIDKEIISSYQINGISHLLAISGMHITLLSSIILFILNHLSKYKKINYFIVITILIFYAFLTNFTPSVVRATALFIIFTIKNLLNLKTETIFLLIALAAIYLFYNPYIIYNIGFLFSFIISFYLILFKGFIKQFKSYFSKTLIVSLIAFLASFPITINNFFEVNLLSPIINMVFVPLVSLVIYPFSLLTLFIKPLDNTLYILTEFMEKLSLVFSHITIFKIILKHINIYFIIVYYIVITYTIYCLSKKKMKGIIILSIIIFFHSNINYLNSSADVTMIDVGQGDSILLNFPYNKGTTLIDTGGQVNFKKQPYDIIKNKTIPYLKSEGIKKIDYLILTHGDFDHMGEAINLINNFKVNNVIFNCGEDNSLEKELIKTLTKKKIKYNKCIKEINIDRYKLQFLNTKIYNNENDNSNVIYLKISDYKFLFMGDSSTIKEYDILNKYNIKNIDFLKVGHHGSNTSSSPKFIDNIRPKYSLISVGKNNMYGHPKNEVLDTLSNTETYRTDKDGSIKIKLNSHEYTIKTCAP